MTPRRRPPEHLTHPGCHPRNRSRSAAPRLGTTGISSAPVTFRAGPARKRGEPAGTRSVISPQRAGAEHVVSSLGCNPDASAVAVRLRPPAPLSLSSGRGHTPFEAAGAGSNPAESTDQPLGVPVVPPEDSANSGGELGVHTAPQANDRIGTVSLLVGKYLWAGADSRATAGQRGAHGESLGHRAGLPSHRRRGPLRSFLHAATPLKQGAAAWPLQVLPAVRR